MGRIYINPKLRLIAYERLRSFYELHADCDCVLSEYVKENPLTSCYEREAFLYAARKLRLNVFKADGYVYDNGVLLWSDDNKLNQEENILFKVSLGGKYGFIDQTGKFVINPQFDYVWDFKEMVWR